MPVGISPADGLLIESWRWNLAHTFNSLLQSLAGGDDLSAVPVSELIICDNIGSVFCACLVSSHKTYWLTRSSINGSWSRPWPDRLD